jgi:hypothetical protein
LPRHSLTFVQVASGLFPLRPFTLAHPRLAVLALSLSAAASAAAGAGEYCVACTGPDALYRCTFDGAAPKAGADSAVQLLCISDIARSKGHATCAINRAAAAPCAGLPYVVSAGGPPATAPAAVPMSPVAPPPAAPLPAAASGNVALAPKPQPPPRAAVPATEPPPAETSPVGAAGAAVGTAAKKTWECVASWFKNC